MMLKLLTSLHSKSLLRGSVCNQGGNENTNALNYSGQITESLIITSSNTLSLCSQIKIFYFATRGY